jgi:hypothetical protein
MRKTFRVLGYLLVAQVVIQAMAIAYALSGLSHYISEDDGVLNKQVVESDDMAFPEVVGFIIHGMNGMMLIPLLALLFLIVSLFAKVPGGTKSAAIVLGLVVLQVVMGIALHSVPFIGALHALNAFAILVVAYRAARGAGDTVAPSPAQPRVGVNA